ncbi:homocysteine S-methyltransferase family protein [uncultured Bacteroides sp.]|uniref:homocysteine S-methyltransferase family protein n=1 Tax=uncultured Bacteroides sp. TaxID=162156 RepID=UPI002AAC2888|nr:homocysteine S-methyltransferase family protein [uncultured Bacteroides sp.]
MGDSSFVTTFHTSPIILTEGAIVERLRREYQIPLDDNIVHAGLIYNDTYRQMLADIYKQYLDVAEAFQLPIMLMTPTRRVNNERVARSVYKDKNIIADNVAFLSQLKSDYTVPVYIGGLVGCRGDAYEPSESLSSDEAMDFHLPHLEAFRKAGADYLFAGIMPALPEATGMAKAMETTGLPYIISFMICKNGTLLDGTSIHNAIASIDANTKVNPLCYTVNCVHPDILHQALSVPDNNTPLVRARFMGIQANASNLSPEELNECTCLKSSSATELADSMMALHRDFPLKIIGGCCGTDNTHLRRFAELFSCNIIR